MCHILYMPCIFMCIKVLYKGLHTNALLTFFTATPSINTNLRASDRPFLFPLYILLIHGEVDRSFFL